MRLIAQTKKATLLAENHSWILCTDKTPNPEPFKDLSPDTCFKSIGGGKNTSAGFPKLEAANGWHYEYNGMLTENISITPDDNPVRILFLFSAFNKYGESALKNLAGNYKRAYAYFCFSWHEKHDFFIYSTPAASGRCVAPIFDLYQKPLITRKKKGQLELAI